MFNWTIKKVNNTNIILGYLPLEVIGKKLDEKKTLFDYFDKFLIQNLSNLANFSKSWLLQNSLILSFRWFLKIRLKIRKKLYLKAQLEKITLKDK